MEKDFSLQNSEADCCLLLFLKSSMITVSFWGDHHVTDEASIFNKKAMETGIPNKYKHPTHEVKKKNFLLVCTVVYEQVSTH